MLPSTATKVEGLDTLMDKCLDLDAMINKGDIAECLMHVSTCADTVIRQRYASYVTRGLLSDVDLSSFICTFCSTLLLILEDDEPAVRLSLINELPDIFKKCLGLDNDHGLGKRYLDALLASMEDSDAQLRKTAFYNVKSLLQNTTPSNTLLKDVVCPAVVKLSKFPIKNKDVDHYSNAIELMALLVTLMGPTDFESYVLDRFLELCQHSNYMVRRWSTDYFPVFCYILGEVTAEKLLPIFTRLCEDMAWSVRKSAAKALPKVALTCSLQRRRDTLAPIAYNLLNDYTRFVTESAFKNLGQFIATFAQPCAVELATGSSGKLYITQKANDTISQNSFNEESTPPPHRPDESGSILDSAETNPYRKFLIGEAFSIQSGSLMDQQNINAQPFQSLFARIFKGGPAECKSTYVSKPQDQQQLNDTIVDDDDTSSGCSSGPCSDSGDDNSPIEELTLADVVPDSNAAEKKNFADDPNYVDDFEDNFSNEILNKLPDGLREVVAQIRETTNAEIRQRNKDARQIMMLTADERLNRRKAEIRYRMYGQMSQPIPSTQLPASLRLFPWKKNKKSDIMVIDNTNVTLRKKGTSQINDDDDDAPSETSNAETSQPPTEPQALTEHDDGEVDELAEFNALNYWKEDLGSIDVDKELDLLKEHELQKMQDDFVKSLGPCHESTIDRLLEPENPDDPPSVKLENLRAKCLVFMSSRAELARSNAFADRVITCTEIIRGDPEWLETQQASEPPDEVHRHKIEKLKARCVGPAGDPNMSFFNQPIVPPYLIEYFVSVEIFADSEFNMYCVYNFPAVVLTLKEKYWNLSYDLLLYLTSDIHWKVRKTIAMFICEIALIIGRENTHRDLLPIFLGFFKDLDEVKIEALKNLPTFLSVIDIAEHPKVLANLGECLQCDNDSNWRFREELARQLLHLIKAYGRVYCINHLIWVTGMAIALLTDKVSAVRTVAMEAIAEKCCSSSPIELKYLVEFLVEDFARHIHWRRRQMFLNICEEMIRKENCPPLEVIESSFLQPILELAKDKIPNIRLAVARLLSLLFSYNQQLHTKVDHPMMFTLMQLQCDEDNDVKFVVNDI